MQESMKRIYLDQNKMIDLARAHFMRDQGEPYRGVYEKIMEKVDSGEWLFPLSFIHVMETSINQDFTQRSDMIEFLMSVTNLNTIGSFRQIEEREFVNATRSLLGKELLSIEDVAFSDNIFHLFEMSQEEAQNYLEELKDDEDFQHFDEKDVGRTFKDLSNSPSTLEFLIKSGILSSKYADRRREWKEGAKDLEESRDELFDQPIDDKYRFNRILVGGFERLKSRYWRKLLDHIDREEDFEVIKRKFQDDPLSLFQKMPTLYTQAGLTFQLYKDGPEELTGNDIKDIIFLSVAIPYCDIVVTENAWEHRVEQQELGQMFGTIVLSDLRELD